MLLLYKNNGLGRRTDRKKEKTMAEENNNQNGTPLTFDEILDDKEYQSEFDKRVAKALETAKAKWEKTAREDKEKAVSEATAPIHAELTRALIQTELVKAKARDAEVVMPLIDTAKITRTEKGLEGLEEQIKSLKEGKAYLFESTEEGTKPKGRSGLEHGENNDAADEAKIKRIMGLPI